MESAVDRVSQEAESSRSGATAVLAVGGLALARAIGLYLALALPLCLLFLGRNDVVSMEGIVALGAKHMRQTGDWWVPRLYGEIYAYKPPLAYWMAAGMDALLGRQTEFTLRLPSTLCGILLGASLVWIMGRMISPRCGLYSGLAAITAGLFIEQVNIAGFDMPVALGLTVAVLASCRNLAGTRASGAYWLLAYAGLLFAFLAKGLPAVVIFAPGLLCAAIAVRRFPRLLEAQHLCAAAAFLFGVTAFALLAYRAEGPEAFHQHLGEIARRSEQWTSKRALGALLKPVVIFGVLLPWSLTLIGWGFEAASKFLKRKPAWSVPLAGCANKLLPLPLPPGAGLAARVAWAFLLTGIVTFLVVPTDDTRYYLALVGPLAMLAGLSLERLPEPWPRRMAVSLTSIGLIVWVVQVAVVQPRRAEKRSLRAVAQAFSPHVPPGAVVHVDTQDSYSSLFHYLGRPVEAWRSMDQQPKAGSLVLVEDDARPALSARSGLEFVSVAEMTAKDEHRYTLGRLTPVEP